MSEPWPIAAMDYWSAYALAAIAGGREPREAARVADEMVRLEEERLQAEFEQQNQREERN